MRSTNVNVRLSRALFIIGLVLSFLYTIQPVKPFSSILFDVGFVIIIICIWIFIRFSQHSSLKGQWLKPSNLFIIAFLAVNFQYLLDYRLGLKNDGSVHIIYPSILNHCLILGIVGLLAFIAGYLRSISEEKKNHYRPIRISERLIIPDSVKIPIVVMHAFVFGLFLITIDINAFLSGEIYGDSVSTFAHLEKLLGVLNVIIVLIATTKAKEGGSFKSYLLSFPWLSLVIIGLYMLLRLISGDRGPFIYSALLLFYGFVFVNRKKYKLVTTILILALSALVMSVIGIARNMDLDQGFFSRISDAADAFTSYGRFSYEKTVLPLTDELGFSFVVNQTDVYAIEVEQDHLHPGSYLILSFLNSIPFVPGLITRAFHISYEDFSSTGFANVHFFGPNERTWSIGTTIIGDFYLQFSVWGVLLGLFLAGLIMKEIDLALYVRDKERISRTLLLFSLAFASKCLYIPRSLLFGELQVFIPAYLILYICQVIFSKRVK